MEVILRDKRVWRKWKTGFGGSKVLVRVTQRKERIKVEKVIFFLYFVLCIYLSTSEKMEQNKKKSGYNTEYKYL